MHSSLLPGVALTAVALGISPAFAADDAQAAIRINAHVPSSQFYALPRDPNFGRDEVMTWDVAANKLRPLRQTYDVKHTEGSIHAYFLNHSGWHRGDCVELWIGGSDPATNGICLEVAFNGVRLDHLAREVVSDAASTPGTSADLIFSYHRHYGEPGRYPGTYTGGITLVFDAVPRTLPSGA